MKKKNIIYISLIIFSFIFFNTSVKAETRNYAEDLMEIGQSTNVSPYFLAAKIIQEQGASGSQPMISGSVSGFEGFYNYYNINANGDDVLSNGLTYAMGGSNGSNTSNERPWNTRYKALRGGALFIKGGYIGVGQDTIYSQKWDYIGTLYTHQYMQNISATGTESAKIYNAYKSISNYKNLSYNFKIPVYKNMPSSISIPNPETGTIIETTASSNNYAYNPISDNVVVYNASGDRVSAIPPTASVKLVDKTTTYVKGMNCYKIYYDGNNIGYAASSVLQSYDYDANASTDNNFQNTLNNFPSSYWPRLKYLHSIYPNATFSVVNINVNFNDFVNNEAFTNGNSARSLFYISSIYSYAGWRLNDSTNWSGGGAHWYAPKTELLSYYLDPRNFLNERYIFMFEQLSYNNNVHKLDNLKSMLGNTFMSGNYENGTSNNNNNNNNNNNTATPISNPVVTPYIRYGDVDSNSVVNSVDMLRVKKYILGKESLSGNKLTAADVNKDGKVNSVDMLMIKKHILGIINL